jgi:hypothetical protein
MRDPGTWIHFDTPAPSPRAGYVPPRRLLAQEIDRLADELSSALRDLSLEEKRRVVHLIELGCPGDAEVEDDAWAEELRNYDGDTGDEDESCGVQ